jgi:hypothetical protein
MSIRPLILALVLAVPAGAHADQLDGATIDLTLKVRDGDSFIVPNDVDIPRYFNQARCLCDSDDDKEYQVEYTWAGTAPSPLPNATLHAWAGASCDQAPADRDPNCRKLSTFDANTLTSVVRVDYNARDLMLPPAAVTCDVDGTRTVQHWLVTQSGSVWDADNRFALFTDGQGTPTTFSVDMVAPALPSELTIAPKEGAIRLTWDAYTQTEVAYFQALCLQANLARAHESPTHTAQYDTASSLCDNDLAYDIPAAVVTNPPAGDPGDLPAAFASLDPALVCGQAGGTATAIELSGLKDGEDYWVVLIAMDKSGNPAATYIDRLITPKPVTDFWETIHEQDPSVQGGFCIAQVGADGQLGAALVALAIVAATRRRRRRRGGRSRLARLSLFGLVLAPTLATAQPNYSPYWEADEPEDLGLSEPAWVLGARLGPYVPSIDDNFEAPGPYAQVFEKDSAMFAIDLHRVWQLEFGQVGFGGTAGYYTNSALAFEDGTTPGDPNRERADGNLTRLSIIPLHLTATFRATILDDRWGVPFVPYARGGLAYNLWWIKNPGDEIAVHASCDTCEDRAIGATIGLVGAVGLAIRAEGIDPGAAASMRDSGLEHAGFFVELEAGWIDGFGNETKLSLGDTTFFGGINFEF